MSHRNEPARERRRQVLKQQLSLRSIPLVEPPVEKYNLNNHFGWQVMQKCRIGDGSFPPYLLHCIYCDKPYVPCDDVCDDGDKVTYVLYIRGQDGTLEPVDVKETQTAFSTTNVITKVMAAPPPEPKEKTKKAKRPSTPNKKIISDFYYIPIRDRVSDKYDRKSPTAIESREEARGDSQDSNPGEIAEKQKGKAKKPKKERARSAPKSWQLRAGAESPDDDDERAGDTTDANLSSEAETEDEEGGTPNTIIYHFKKYTRIPTVEDCSNCFGRSPTNVELKESLLEKNRYLYMPRERYEKRPKSAQLLLAAIAQPSSDLLMSSTIDRPPSGRLTSLTMDRPPSGRLTSPSIDGPKSSQLTTATVSRLSSGQLTSPIINRPPSRRLTSPSIDRPKSGQLTTATVARLSSDRPTSPTVARPSSAKVKDINNNDQYTDQ